MTQTPISLSIQPGTPDLLDLPWNTPVPSWAKHCDLVADLPRGISRHPVIFLNVEGTILVVKELPKVVAEREFRALIQMGEAQLPVVRPLGHALTRTPEGESSILITQFLEHSLPYRFLFGRSTQVRYREHLLDAMAGLLVQLHLVGVYWGDCSLSNTLFRRDAGTLMAYLVDAETAEVRPTISEGMRLNDLALMEENVTGELADLVAAGSLPASYPVYETGASIQSRYLALWEEITREETFSPQERYRIHERVGKLNSLGFSVRSLELLSAEDGEQLRLRAVVTDRAFHRSELHGLTGIEAESFQARLMMNEIHEVRAALNQSKNHSTPLSLAAHHWLNQVYLPIVGELSEKLGDDIDLPERYCQVLEHKWYLSEQARGDVGHHAALSDFIARESKSDPIDSSDDSGQSVHSSLQGDTSVHTPVMADV